MLHFFVVLFPYTFQYLDFASLISSFLAALSMNALSYREFIFQIFILYHWNRIAFQLTFQSVHYVYVYGGARALISYSLVYGQPCSWAVFGDFVRSFQPLRSIWVWECMFTLSVQRHAYIAFQYKSTVEMGTEFSSSSSSSNNNTTIRKTAKPCTAAAVAGMFRLYRTILNTRGQRESVTNGVVFLDWWRPPLSFNSLRGLTHSLTRTICVQWENKPPHRNV